MLYWNPLFFFQACITMFLLCKFELQVKTVFYSIQKIFLQTSRTDRKPRYSCWSDQTYKTLGIKLKCVTHPAVFVLHEWFLKSRVLLRCADTDGNYDVYLDDGKTGKTQFTQHPCSKSCTGNQHIFLLFFFYNFLQVIHNVRNVTLNPLISPFHTHSQ